ncbi:EthD domain-domain-containing protein [Clohesyomyces aquaticus]|uniref:EthD domain-domain-containing protein n=1 Tax=Clohesyomyces aquaticus TaxID=1231657 RepID=A0A1Y1Z9W6_9PLEO|nr:EthD domain-domain-containing protein [Clohesyomyces aquaticus]
MVHNKIDHQFAFKEFEWDAKENYQPCIKLSFFFKKLPNVDDDHFQKHYSHVHADLTVASKQFNVVRIQRYVQLYQSPEMKEKIKSFGMELLDYDACSQIWVKSWDDWEKFVTSPEYAAALMPDTEHFMDVKGEGIKVMAG